MMITITEVEFLTPGGIKVKRVKEEDLRDFYAFPVAVKEDICCGCRLCEVACEDKNIRFIEEEGVVAINEVACKGCGTCVAVCPSGALYHRFFSTEQVFAVIDADRDLEACELCPLSLAVDVDASKPEKEKRSIRLVCSTHAEPSIILRYFESGVDGVMVINCCSEQNVSRQHAERSVKVAKELIETLGMDAARVHLEWISPFDPEFDKKIGEFARRI